MADSSSAFKNLIHAGTVRRYVRGFSGAKIFDAQVFFRACGGLETLELKARARLIADALRSALPGSYPGALSALLKAVSREGIEGFELWPATEFVQRHGLQHFEESFLALQKLTPKFTAEFAIRPFILRDPKRVFAALSRLVSHEDEHLRRWVSEGTRPRLPWGERLSFLVEDPSTSLELIEPLRFDPSLYVRKSVANHLNDIAKDHPERVVSTLKRWSKEVPKGFEKEFAFVRARALRTLIKAGHPGALAALGVKAGGEELQAVLPRLNRKRIRVGEGEESVLEFEFELRNRTKREVRYLVDYVIHHRKAKGSHSPKVFKLRSGTLGGGESVTIKKRHAFRPITTRVYHAGEHRLGLLVNGRPGPLASFQLEIGILKSRRIR